MATKNEQEISDMDKNIAAQEELAKKGLNLTDDSDKLKENKNPIDTDTATNSPTKGTLDIADELISEADYTPSDKQKAKIEEKAKKKLQEKSGLADDQFNETLNYQPAEPREQTEMEKAAAARLHRSAMYDAGKRRGDPEYDEAKKLENEALAKVGIDPDGMTEDEAKRILDDYQATLAREAEKDEYMSYMRDKFQAQLNKIIDDDTKSWTERKKLIDKTGLLFGHVMQSIGAMMHNAVNPTDWITASDPITLRAGQNLANTIKNRQANNNTYIDSQIEYWKSILPEYYDAAKIKQRLGNSRIRSEYSRLNAAGQKMIMALAASDAWDVVSNNGILAFMDNLQDGKYQTTEQMITGLIFAALTSSSENRTKVVDKLTRFAKDLGLDKLVDKIISKFEEKKPESTFDDSDDFSGLETANAGNRK